MMNQGDIFKKIGQILNELQDQYEFLAQNPEQLNELELELFLANASFLTDHVEIVKKLNFNKSVKELPQHTESINEVEEIPVPLPISENVTEAKDEEQELPSTFEFILNENAADKFEPEEKVEEEKEIPFIKTELAEDKIEVGEVFKANINSGNEAIQLPEVSQRPTLNELLAGRGNNNNNLSDKAPITDLKKAITLNEKLLYIKDLFNGYNLAYSEAIDLINKMPDFKTADTFLRNNYAAKNNWETRQSTVDQFYELLNQRFPQG